MDCLCSGSCIPGQQDCLCSPRFEVIHLKLLFVWWYKAFSHCYAWACCLNFVLFCKNYWVKTLLSDQTACSLVATSWNLNDPQATFSYRTFFSLRTLLIKENSIYLNIPRSALISPKGLFDLVVFFHHVCCAHCVLTVHVYLENIPYN